MSSNQFLHWDIKTKHIANLLWRINPMKKAPLFWTFFHWKVRLKSAPTLFFARPIKWFQWIWMLIFCNPRGRNFWNFYHMFLSQHTTRSYFLMAMEQMTLVLDWKDTQDFWQIILTFLCWFVWLVREQL